MARVQLRKAAKAYPQNGIEKGDQYYFAQIKTGPRSSRIIRSKSPIPRSQLTTSAFKSELYDIEDTGFDRIETANDLREVAQRVRDLGDETRSSFDNMPEGLQQGDTGQMLEERADAMDSWADEIESAADELENELDAFDRMVEELPAYVAAKAEYDELLAAFEDDETGELPEPVEPDEPELPDGLDPSDIEDEAAVAGLRQELIDNRVQEAQDANPGVE